MGISNDTRDTRDRRNAQPSNHGGLPRGAREGTRRALLEVEPDRYESTRAAVRAALKNVPRYVCDDCGRWGFAEPRHCAECGGTEFTHRRLTAEERRRGRA